MRRIALLLATSLLAVALSGCASDDVPGADPEDLSDLAGEETPAPRVNTAPVANLTADLTNGTAPLNVTFTLSGSDADGDNLTWSFDAGDGNTTANGTELPATVNVTYAVGNHSAVFTLFDGTNETAQTFLVNVTEAASTVAEDTRTILEGEVSATCETCYIVGSNACVDWNLGSPGGDCIWFELDPELVGQPFVTESPGDADLEFRTDCSLTSDSVEIHGVEGQESGTVPDAGCVVLFEFSNPGLLRFIVG